ncbi:ATP-binding protein [Candidatus Woesearchaeota archaeon]|nr:ATP-binding protein [Candidatus Woesearchaeota archaeon]
MDFQTLQKQNPWWENPSRINEDINLIELESFPLKWTPRLLKHINFEKNAVYSIRGPRQIGKTTTIKMVIKKLLETMPAQNIFYFACDNLKDNIDLAEVLEIFYDRVRAQNKERIYIFLDEISYVKDWQKAIKYFIDTKGSQNITITLTGSNILDLKKSSERLPGRVGEKEGVNSNKILLPMKFAEFIELKNPELHTKIKALRLDEHETRAKDFQKILDGTLPESIWALSYLQQELDRLLEDYLITGGIMLAINEHHKTGRISHHIYDLYTKQIFADITRAGRDENTAKFILSSILKKMGTPSSWNGISKENNIPSQQTVEQYTYILRDIFALSICYKIEITGSQKYAGNRKIYVSNPFIYNALFHALFDPAKDPYLTAKDNITDPEKKSVLIEALILNHLSRACYNLMPSDLYEPSDLIFYTRTKKGIEIDFLVKTSSGLRGIEVKYQNQINAEDFIGIRKLKSGVIISKNKLEQKERFAVIPVSLFLLYI